jgi:hypothetical protein
LHRLIVQKYPYFNNLRRVFYSPVAFFQSYKTKKKLKCGYIVSKNTLFYIILAVALFSFFLSRLSIFSDNSNLIRLVTTLCQNVHYEDYIIITSPIAYDNAETLTFVISYWLKNLDNFLASNILTQVEIVRSEALRGDHTV